MRKQIWRAMENKCIRLKVDKIGNEDFGRGIIRMAPEHAESLNVDVGDVVGIKGLRSVCARVMILPLEYRGRAVVLMDELTVQNAGTEYGSDVDIFPVKFNKAAAIHISVDTRSKGYSRSIGIDYIKKMKLNHCVATGDIFDIKHLGLIRPIYKVIKTFPEGYVIVDSNTKFVFEENADIASKNISLGYKDIGGLDHQLGRIKEIIEYPLTYPELFSRLGLEPCRGILLYGPPGTGKTLIAKAIANEIKAEFITINGPEIVNKYYGESEAKLRGIFEEARKNSPCIIFIDEIDAIAPKREEVQGDVEKRIVAQLLSLMDGTKDMTGVVVIGATNLPNSLDPALRRPGRFDKEIHIGVPDEAARLDILKIHTGNMPLESDVQLHILAAMTHGYVGADLSALCKEASMNCIRRFLSEQPVYGENISQHLNDVKVTQKDFLIGLNEIRPSAIREVEVEIPHVTWNMVGGLYKVKEILRECIEWPLKYSTLFTTVNIKPPKGIMLYGPPGTGKTMVAKAIATESGVNFISVKGPEILSKWQGDTEKGIRDIFRKGRQTAPCIIFFDEMDSFTNPNQNNSQAQSTVLAQLLTEMDGIEGLENVIVIGATNRIEVMDKALLRAGRFDLIIKFENPSNEERLEILHIQLANKPMDESVDLESIVDATEGFSGAEIAGVCKKAALLALKKYLDKYGEDCMDLRHLRITQNEFETALKQRMEVFNIA